MNEIQDIDLAIEQLREVIALSDALQRLEKNEDFKKVFLEYLLKDEAVRLVNLLAVSGINKEDVIKDLTHISAIRQLFIDIHRKAEAAEVQIYQYQEAREEILAEEAEGV